MPEPTARGHRAARWPWPGFCPLSRGVRGSVRCEQGGGHPRCLPWTTWRRADAPSWGHTQGTQGLGAAEAQGGSSGLGGSFCLEITCCCGCTQGSPSAQHMLTEHLLCAALRRGCPPDPDLSLQPEPQRAGARTLYTLPPGGQVRVAGQSFDLVGAMTCPEPRKSVRGVEGTWERQWAVVRHGEDISPQTARWPQESFLG